MLRYYGDRQCGRTPHGVRGLKSGPPLAISRPELSRTPHGVRGLKFGAGSFESIVMRRTPHGVRGLKYYGGIG